MKERVFIFIPAFCLFVIFAAGVLWLRIYGVQALRPDIVRKDQQELIQVMQERIEVLQDTIEVQQKIIEQIARENSIMWDDFLIRETNGHD